MDHPGIDTDWVWERCYSLNLTGNRGVDRAGDESLAPTYALAGSDLITGAYGRLSGCTDMLLERNEDLIR
ncbi:unnamed protein product [marine sediment metagenome]|uniref:Uncharacterized protein n=1 Tax=marine sediment metagenome TaxID=412755 RepID=X1IWD8_9ZZZZ